MKLFARILYYCISIALILYLGYSYVNGTINYDYIWNMDWILLAVTIVAILGMLRFSISSHHKRKKWIMIAWSLVILGLGQGWFMDTTTFFGSDMIKLYAVITIFKALFGAFTQKLELVKGEYSKKAQIIEV